MFMINVVEYRMITSYISEYGLTTDDAENSGCSVSLGYGLLYNLYDISQV